MITDALQIHITLHSKSHSLCISSFYCKKEPINLSTVTFSDKLLFKPSDQRLTYCLYLSIYLLPLFLLYVLFILEIRVALSEANPKLGLSIFYWNHLFKDQMLKTLNSSQNKEWSEILLCGTNQLYHPSSLFCSSIISSSSFSDLTYYLL